MNKDTEPVVTTTLRFPPQMDIEIDAVRLEVKRATGQVLTRNALIQQALNYTLAQYKQGTFFFNQQSRPTQPLEIEQKFSVCLDHMQTIAAAMKELQALEKSEATSSDLSKLRKSLQTAMSSALDLTNAVTSDPSTATQPSVT